MQIVVIGGNPAGLSAASAIRRAHSDWEIDVFEKGEYVSYGACGIPYYVSDEVKNLNNLITLTSDDLEKKRNIPVHLFHEVSRVDFKHKKVYIKALKNEITLEKKYDYLIIATGAKAKIPLDIPNHPHIFKIHTLDDAKILKNFLEINKINSIAIIGAGYIGLEMLESYIAQGIDAKNITVIGPRLVFNSITQDYIRKELEKYGIKILLKNRVRLIEPLSQKNLKITLENEDNLEVDLIQLSIGVIPDTDIFKGTELRMAPNGAILTDRYMQTNIENVFAAGDCVASYHRIMKKNVYVPLAPAANKQGRIAGSRIAGIDIDPFPGILGTTIFKVLDLFCARTGIDEIQAKELGYENVQATQIESNDIAHYYPGVKKMSVRLIYDKDSHLLLGAEIIAASPLGAKKIDVIATALSAGMTIEELQKLDLAYAPPFSPVWDPILVAANIARKNLN